MWAEAAEGESNSSITNKNVDLCPSVSMAYIFSDLGRQVEANVGLFQKFTPTDKRVAEAWNAEARQQAEGWRAGRRLPPDANGGLSERIGHG